MAVAVTAREGVWVLTQVAANCENPMNPILRMHALFCMHVELESKVKIG